jgi:hypothetical protein
MNMGIFATVGRDAFPHLVGYRIWCEYTPAAGFQGRFGVDLLEQMDAGERLVELSLGRAGPAPRVNLQISGEGRNYTFNDIEFDHMETGTTSRQRYRWLHYRYPLRPAAAQVQAVLSNRNTAVPNAGRLGGDYLFGLGSFPLQLLGFQARLSVADGTVFKFTTLRNSSNSMMEKVVELNNRQAVNGAAMQAFEVQFSQGNIRVDDTNLVRILVEELYGALIPLREQDRLADALGAAATPGTEIGDSPLELIEHWNQSTYIPPEYSHTIESSRLVFSPGWYRDRVIR